MEEFVTMAGNLEEELFATRDSEVTDDEKWNSRLIANTERSDRKAREKGKGRGAISQATTGWATRRVFIVHHCIRPATI